MRKTLNCNWTIEADATGSYSFPQAQLAVLMDIREELRAIRMTLQNRLNCGDFIAIPRVLQEIKRNTQRRKRPKAPANGHRR